jgi:hydroxymethylpyrimidine pyrophosphatase-like HAD family hydrolase
VSLTLFYINCDFSQISKATGIRRLLSQTGIDPHRTAGIGDTSSDLGIAEVVETFGCPSNAIESVKAAADFISEHEQIDGVLDFIQYLESN